MSKVTDIRPNRTSIPRVPSPDPNLRLDLELDDIVRNSIKYVLQFSKNPLEIETNLVPTTLDEQSFYTLKTIFRIVKQNQYALPQIRFNTNPPLKFGYAEMDAVFSYLYTCKPAKLSTILTLLAVYKHYTLASKEQWRKMYNPAKQRYYSGKDTLLNDISHYIYNNYVCDNLSVAPNRTGVEPAGRYASSTLPNIHWFWESQDRWIENDLEFDALASLVVKSGLVTLWPMYYQSSRAQGFPVYALNLCITPEIMEEFISDHLSLCTSVDYVGSYSTATAPGMPVSLSQMLSSRVAPARADKLHAKFKRFNRVRTQMLMRLAYLMDDASVFGADFMTLEFEADTRTEVQPSVAFYKQLLTTEVKMPGIPKRPIVEALTSIKEIHEYTAKCNADRRYREHTAPAVAICKVMSATYRCAESLAILESHVREYR